MFDRIEFILGEAFQGMRRHSLMSFAAISTVAIALYLFGGLSLVYVMVQNYANEVSSRYEVQAYFRDGVTQSEISEAAKKIRSMPGVASAVWIPREKAWEKEKAKNPELTQGIDNPFPHAIRIRMSDVAQVNAVVSGVKGIGTIQADHVQYHDPTQRLLNDILKLIRWLGGVIGVLLFATAGTLIYNAIRLTISARKREIRIMQLVGASHLTVRVPFLIEGIFQGVVGGFVATFLLWSTYRAIEWYVQGNLTAMSASLKFPTIPVVMALTACGAIYGLVCSVLAIRGPSRLRARGF